MKEAFWSVAFIVAGIVGLAFLILAQNLTSTDQQNYYLAKEVTTAAMLDAVDMPYYRYSGNVRIISEKFVENFARRWAESADRLGSYEIDIYDIIELPPKVSIRILGRAESFGSLDEFQVKNRLDMIIERKYNYRSYE